MKSKNSLKTNKKFIETQSDIQAIFFFKLNRRLNTIQLLMTWKSGYLKNFLCLAFELILL